MSGGHPLDLRGTQELFWNLVTAPEGVAHAVQDLAACGDLPGEDLSFFLEPSATLAPVERLDIYANMYFYRLRDLLAEDFPKTAAVVGGAAFHNLITDFLLVHPSSHPSLRWLGRPLPDYLGAHDLGGEHAYLGDLARLEWARLDVFDAADAAPLTREGLTALSAGTAETAALSVIPACRLLALDHNVAPLWLRIEEERGSTAVGGTHSAAVESCDGFTDPFKVETPPERRPSFLRAWRQDFKIFHRSMPPDEAACLRLMQEPGGGSLTTLAETLMAQVADDAGDRAVGTGADDDADAVTRAMQRLAQLMDLWMEDGLITLTEAAGE